MTAAEIVNSWFAERLACGAIARTTEAYNQVHEALPDLIARLDPSAAAPVDEAPAASWQDVQQPQSGGLLIMQTIEAANNGTLEPKPAPVEAVATEEAPVEVQPEDETTSPPETASGKKGK